MSLLDDLQAIDLSALTDARGGITAAIDADDIQALIGDGAIQHVLGDLGANISQVRQGLDDPATLFEPLVGGLADLLRELGLDHLPVGDFADAVSTGAQVLAAVFGVVNGDLAPVGDLLARSGGPIGDFTSTTLREAGRFRALVDRADDGLPDDPEALVELVIDLLLPFPRATLVELRTHVDVMLDGLGALSLRSGALTGLTRTLVDVRAAADAGDSAAVRAALARVERLGDEAVTSLGNDVRAVAQRLSALRIDLGIDAIAGVTSAIRSGESDVVEFLDRFREMVEQLRAAVAQLDGDALRTRVTALLDLAEHEARARLNSVVDDQLARLTAWLRSLLAPLGIVELRRTVTDAIHTAAQTIADAGLDRAAREIRSVVSAVDDAVGDATATVQGAKQQIVDALAGAFDAIEASLGVITDRIDAVADEAQAVLQRGVDALRAFRTAVDAIQADIDSLGIDSLTQQVVDNLRELRESAEALVTQVPVPDQLRPVIDQLVSAIESVDLDATIGAPLREAAAQLDLPADVATGIDDALGTVAHVVSSLLPTEVIKELEEQMQAMIDAVGDLDLSSLTSGVSGLLGDVADFLEDIDLVAAVEPVAGAFDQVLALVDRAHPRQLLAPVIQAYDSALGHLSLPDPDTFGRRVAQLTSTAGEAAARGAASPIQTLAPEGSTLAPPTPAGGSGGAGGPGGASGGAGSGASTAGPSGDRADPLGPIGTNVRAGDIVRLLGFFPAKVHEVLVTLDEAGLGAVLAGVDRLCGGLATDLRRIRAEVLAAARRVEDQLDAQLRALSDAQIDAQLALRANASLSTGGLDVHVSIGVVASVGAPALRGRIAEDAALVDARTTDALGQLTGAAAAELERIAAQLERCALGGLVTDTEAFLAALDVEPIAVEIDGLVVDVLDKMPELLGVAQSEIVDAYARVRALVDELNPAALAHKFLGLLDVLKEQFDVLDPGRLADELAEVHAAIRAVIAAYDPRALAHELDDLIADVATALRALDPAVLLGDMSDVQAQLARLPALLPTAALEGVGTALDGLSAELVDIDVPALFELVEKLAPEVVDAITRTIAAIQTEIVALLHAIQYAQTSGSASVSGSIG